MGSSFQRQNVCLATTLCSPERSFLLCRCEGISEVQELPTCLPRSGFVQRSFCTGAGGVTPQVARRLSDQDRMQRYRMPVRFSYPSLNGCRLRILLLQTCCFRGIGYS